ncbi:hypothetical protein SNOG_04366 [Parastagonospora nodorum SN15]|uniref:Uncharacterized protein n=1 Tax=Phaeosphaeria nodorum (strain SN15 / ATCC MYA-4574 / FGSC 10173) TaxID=321614 RepID=Q0UV48_PHANO|nr:hypothetical protein SNOG_04366 [Parastagonospora nodorum SN15]EAT88126.1 hypothetical protein SNOG_04366 [Parastagonospora nodorum SN15]
MRCNKTRFGVTSTRPSPWAWHGTTTKRCGNSHLNGLEATSR